MACLRADRRAGRRESADHMKIMSAAPPRKAAKDERAIFDLIQELYKKRRAGASALPSVQAKSSKDAASSSWPGNPRLTGVSMILNAFNPPLPEGAALFSRAEIVRLPLSGTAKVGFFPGLCPRLNSASRCSATLPETGEGPIAQKSVVHAGHSRHPGHAGGHRAGRRSRRRGRTRRHDGELGLSTGSCSSNVSDA